MDNVWTNLGNRLETTWKRPTRPNSKRPKDGEIIDEEKSVRWNREEVVRRQKAWDAECSRLKKAQNAEIEHISEAIELQIQEDIKAETKRSISLSDDTLEIGCSIMTDGIKDFVQRNAGIPCERFSREEFFDIKTECNEFDPIYDECRASDFFWATAAVEFAGIDKMTLKEVLAAV